MEHYFFTFIPKIIEAKEFRDYILTIFYNAIYKIIIKNLVERLKPILSNIISSEQDGFIKGRQIIDGII